MLKTATEATSEIDLQPLTDHVYDWFVDRLYDGHFRPGQLVNRQEIARLLGVSAGTVLFAIRRLATDGFIEVLPRKGTLIRNFGFQEVYGQLLVREAFECEAARLYCGQPVIDHWDSLMPMAKQLDGILQYNATSIQLDSQFHEQLISLTGQPIFIEHYLKVMKLSTFFAFLYFIPDQKQLERASHVELLAELRTADKDLAERAIRSHIRKGREQFFPTGS